MAELPSSQRRTKDGWAKPKRAKGKRKKIGEDMSQPGGPHTPGAKGTYPKKGK
jgi:hypothetical protein